MPIKTQSITCLQSPLCMQLNPHPIHLINCTGFVFHFTCSVPFHDYERGDQQAKLWLKLKSHLSIVLQHSLTHNKQHHPLQTQGAEHPEDNSRTTHFISFSINDDDGSGLQLLSHLRTTPTPLGPPPLTVSSGNNETNKCTTIA